MKLFEHKSDDGKKITKFLFPVILILICVAVIHQSRGSYRPLSVEFIASDGSESVMELDMFENTPLLNVNTGERENISFDDSDYTLLILLSGGDCPKGMMEKDVWADLIKEFSQKNLRVIGVISRTLPGEAQSFIKGFNLPFTVYLDENNQLSQATSLPKATPFKVFLNKRKVVFVDGITSKTSDSLRKKVIHEINIVQ